MPSLKILAILVTCFTGPQSGQYTNAAVTSAESVNGAMRYTLPSGDDVVDTHACFATDGIEQPAAQPTHAVECHVDGVRRWHSEVANPQLLGDGALSWYDVTEGTSVLATNAACRIDPL